MLSLLIDNSAAIYQFTIVVIFVTSLLFFGAMYWYSISLRKSLRVQEQKDLDSAISNLELEQAELKNKFLESEKKAREERSLRLEQAVSLKNHELVSSTLLYDQQKKTFDEIAVLLCEIENNGGNDLSGLRKIKGMLRTHESREESWDLFRKQFDQVHPDFFAKLESTCTRLSQNDLRHCAYLRMRMSTKEIAQLLNINPTSVQIARVRLKKKLELLPEQDLRSFILSI